MKTQAMQMNAGEALTALRFVDNQGLHTVDVPAVGATESDVAIGDPITWQDPNKPWVIEAAGVITVGTHQYVKSDADGKAVGVASTFDGKVCGIPLDSAAAAGDFIRVKPIFG